MRNEVTSLTATELAGKIKAGELSALEVVDAHIRRIEEVDGKLNAVVIRTFDQARADAEAADRARKSGNIGPLHGVPITIKEQYRVLGTQTTLGISKHVGEIASSEGPLVTRLRQAGAIILGKTNISQCLLYMESDNPVYGRTNNPWNLNRTPGGSSGGEAAIVAAGGSALGLAGDFGGSTRVPAHFCGIHGLKPTARRLSNDDLATEPFKGGQEAIVAQPGPVARSVEDLDLMMRVLAAPLATHTTEVIPPIHWTDYKAVSVASLRIGMYIDDGYYPAAPALRRAVREAAAILEGLGAKVEEFRPPAVDEAVRLFLAVTSSDGGAWLKHMLAGEKPDKRVGGLLQAAAIPNAVRPFVAKMMESAGQRRLAFAVRAVKPKSAREYWQTIDELNAYRARFLGAMAAARVDALICHPYAVPAMIHGTGDRLTIFSAGSNALLFNVLGFPAGSVAATRVRSGEETDRTTGKDPMDRAGLLVEQGSVGLPIGVQVAAPHWREDVVLAIMAALETSFRTHPDYPHWPPL